MTWPDLEPGEVLMPDPDPTEFILRAVKPGEVDEGVIEPKAFVLSQADRTSGKFSGARATLQTPNGLRAEQEKFRPGKCEEVRGVTVAEVESCGALRVIDDHVLFPDITGHASIDFRKIADEAKAARLLVRERLAFYATRNGRLDSATDS